jgi:N-formylglutamate amidohydrolase
MDSLTSLRHKATWSKTRLAEESTSSFEILAPVRWSAPMVFNSPHSGRALPHDLRLKSRLTEQQLRASEDAHIHDLFTGCLDAGAPLLRALVSRAYVDLNREPYELDQRMFKSKLPMYVNCASPRVASGLGTIPRTVGDGLLIYDALLDFAEAQQRIENHYRPYHRALGALLDEAHTAAGVVLLVDCHSMPSSAVSHMASRTDIVLGDRFGSACDPEITAIVDGHMREAGLHLSRNKPYSGGFFTENHGRPRLGRHALQIEVNRALYMNEASHAKNSGFAALQNVMRDMAHEIAQWLATQDEPGQLAAAE